MAEHLFTLRFKGGRWDDGRLPASLLGRLPKLEKVIRRIARAEWLEANEARSRAPKSLGTDTVLAVAVREGSSELDIATFGAGFTDFLEESLGDFEDLISGAGDDAPPELAAWLDDALSTVELKDGEVVQFVRHGVRQPLDSGARMRIAEVADTPVSSRSAPAAVVISPVRFDTEAMTVAGRLREGSAVRKFEVSIKALEAAFDLGRKEGDQRLLRLSGFRSYRGKRSDAAYAQRHAFVGGPPMNERLKQLEAVEDGWLGNGEGAAPTKKLLHLARRALWRVVELCEVDRPHLYPTFEGGLNAEWDITDGVVGLEMTVEGERLRFQADVAWRDGREEELETTDLGEVVAWLNAVVGQ